MLGYMKVTIDIDDDLLREAERKAADEGVALREVVETALRAYLPVGAKSSGYRLRWRTEQGRLRPGINHDSRDSLFDLPGD
jgi:hypothetical protein